LARNARRSRHKQRLTWSHARKLSQVIALLAFLASFLGLYSARLPGSLANLFLRLDPLAVLAQSAASRTWLAGSAIALLTLGLTLVFGRAWCGWVCPLGTLLDLLPLHRIAHPPFSDKERQTFGPPSLAGKGEKMSKFGRLQGVMAPCKRSIFDYSPPPDSWRKAKILLLIAIVGMALAGNLTLLVLDPLTLSLRSLSSAIWPALDRLVTALETTLYPLPGLGQAVAAFDTWARPALLPSQPLDSRAGWLFAAALLAVVALNAWAPRFWCRYLCPLGGLLGLLSRIALVRRVVNEECSGCARCERSCPTGTIDPQRGYASDPAECTLCMDCLEECPRSSIRFPGRVSLAEAQPYDPGRRQALATFALAIAGTSLVAAGDSSRERHPFLLQPPGGRQNDLVQRCIRCGACVRACPTAALQPALAEARLEGFWTPVLVPRLGYCDYSCNACGQVCPVEAIPPLALEDKRQQVIGLAAIDRDRCIAWAEQGECIICEEMCPVPQKAVYLEETSMTERNGPARSLLRPHVDPGLCIGCGICEYRCPVVGPAAIRVYSLGDETPPAGI